MLSVAAEISEAGSSSAVTQQSTEHKSNIVAKREGLQVRLGSNKSPLDVAANESGSLLRSPDALQCTRIDQICSPVSADHASKKRKRPNQPHSFSAPALVRPLEMMTSQRGYGPLRSNSESDHQRQRHCDPLPTSSSPYQPGPLSRRPFVPIVCIFCDRDLNLLRFNKEATEILGFNFHQLRRMRLQDLLSKRDVPVLQSVFQRMALEGFHNREISTRSKNIVSTVHPAFYEYAPPSVLMMAAPSALTYSVNVLISHADGSLAPYRLVVYRSGAFNGIASSDGASSRETEAQFYLSVTLVRAGYESIVRDRAEFQLPIVIDLTQDPAIFSNLAFLKKDYNA